jgi:hypothetical protein
MFNRIWDRAGLPRPLGGQQPRPYDFRHHFAYANIRSPDIAVGLAAASAR